MTHYVGLDVSQRMTAICVVDEAGRRIWRGECRTVPEQIKCVVRRYAGEDSRIGIETGAMTPWLVHELRDRRLDVVGLDARHARAALKMQINKTDQNDAEGLAQIMRTGWYRPVYVKSFEAHRARALLGARSQLIGMTTRLSNAIRGTLKTFGLLPGSARGQPFDRRVESLLEDRADLASIVRPMLTAWRQLREQIKVFDDAAIGLSRCSSQPRVVRTLEIIFHQAIAAVFPAGAALDAADRGAAQWSMGSGCPAGRGADALSGGRLFLPLRTSRGVTRVVGFGRGQRPDILLTPDERRLVDALID